MKINSTRLRLFKSKDIEQLLAAINNLGHKVEIKSGPMIVKGKWHVFFVPPDDDNPVINKMPMIVDLG